MRPSTKVARLIASAASDNAAKAFDGAVVLNAITGYNAKASNVFLKLYALGPALAVPASTDTPEMTIALPASSAFELDIGLMFNFGMGYRITTGSADNDTGAIAANDILGLNFLAS